MNMRWLDWNDEHTVCRWQLVRPSFAYHATHDDKMFNVDNVRCFFGLFKPSVRTVRRLIAGLAYKVMT